MHGQNHIKYYTTFFNVTWPNLLRTITFIIGLCIILPCGLFSISGIYHRPSQSINTVSTVQLSQLPLSNQLCKLCS